MISMPIANHFKHPSIGAVSPTRIGSALMLVLIIALGIFASPMLPTIDRETGANQSEQRRPRRRLTRVPPLAIVNGVLIDGSGAPPLVDAVVVVSGEYIAAVGRRGEVAIPADATVFDVRGGAILPGLINAHVHSNYQVDLLREWALAGVTTLRDLCASANYAYVDRLSQDPGNARLVASGPFVTVAGGYPAVPLGVIYVVNVTSPEHGRSVVNNLVDQGADVIKIALESGAPSGRSLPMLSPEQAAAVVDAAHARGVRVSAHVNFSRDMVRALDAGVDDIAHMITDPIPETLLQRAIEQNVAWVPTLEVWRHVSPFSEANAIANLRRIVLSGGIIALGTDYGAFTGRLQLGLPILEMELMQQAGMTPMQVIVAATRNGAIVSGRGGDLGTIESGKIADLLVVTGDPLADLHALSAVMMVVRSGVVIRSEL